MKILIISQFAGSRKHGMVLRNYNWALEMTRMGHDVTILSSSYAHPRVTQPETNAKITTENIDGIRYLWLKAKLKYNPKNFVSRVFSMLSFATKCFFMPREYGGDYDVVIASSPQPLIIYAAKKIADKNNAKLVFDIRDLWPLSLMALSKSNSFNPVIWLFQKAEDYACTHADLVTAVPGNCENYLKEQGLGEGKFLHIPNGLVHCEHTDEKSDQSNFIKDLCDKGAFVIGYTGGMGSANAIDCALKSLAQLSNSNVHFVIVGKGPKKNDLESLTKDLNIQSNVHFLPPVESHYIPTILDCCDVVYAGTQRKKLYEYGASLTKLNDYMLASKPIIYAVGDVGNAVEKSQSGLLCEAENIDQISNAMETMFDMTLNEREQMGQKGREWVLKNNMVKNHIDNLFKKISIL